MDHFLKNEHAVAAALKFKNYRIICEVGAGGLGRVFKAVDLRTQKIVAIKILHEEYQKNRKFVGIFHRELLTISRLKHKHIVEFLDCNFDPPDCFIVTEYVDGWSLNALMRQCGAMPPIVALCIGMDILQGIDYLHLHDVVHSDLSAANVLVDKTGRILVTDFGLAVHSGVEDYRNSMIGTPGYYSPEHITQAAITPRSDIYCIGLLIFEMITACRAVAPNKDRREILSQMKAIDFDRITAKDRDLEKSLVKILKTALKLNPSGRFESAETMMLQVYRVLRAYNIRYTGLGIRQFLVDSKLAPPAQFALQNIYLTRPT